MRAIKRFLYYERTTAHKRNDRKRSAFQNLKLYRNSFKERLWSVSGMNNKKQNSIFAIFYILKRKI